jgi:site-specific DNA-adenine methylase
MGDVDNYVEPFAGSLAVLLGRPAAHTGRTETVNDKDAYLANFWRALAADPEAVAEAADWPVNETDLIARHIWLVTTGRERIARLEGDPDYYDAKVAGWWVWGQCSWIGSGWCSGNGPWTSINGECIKGNAGRGVNRQLPHLGNRGADKPGRQTDATALVAYFNTLATRLRGVRVCCGDWSRVVTGGALAFGGTVGVFLDPPYSGDVRNPTLYSVEDLTVAESVRDWAIANGNDSRLRIVLAGYEDEHLEQMQAAGWRMVAWKANAAYQQADSDGQNKSNRKQERLWMSPHCRRGGRLL